LNPVDDPELERRLVSTLGACRVKNWFFKVCFFKFNLYRCSLEKYPGAVVSIMGYDFAHRALGHYWWGARRTR
jgi:hypothetical protein